MRTVWVLQHDDAEPAALIHTVLRRQNLLLAPLRPDHEPLPEALPADCAALVVMGGPMSVYEQERLPWIGRELGLLREALATARPVLGVCLGAQLLAAAGGARVYPGDPPKEIGWGTVKLSAEGRRDPLSRFLANPNSDEPTTVFQWHGDTFDLPAGAVLLARSTRVPHQAFRLGRAAYGFQFHFEVNEQLVRSWTSLWRKEMLAQGFSADEIFSGMKEHLPLLNRRGEELVRAFASLIHASPIRALGAARVGSVTEGSVLPGGVAEAPETGSAAREEVRAEVLAQASAPAAEEGHPEARSARVGMTGREGGGADTAFANAARASPEGRRGAESPAGSARAAGKEQRAELPMEEGAIPGRAKGRAVAPQASLRPPPQFKGTGVRRVDARAPTTEEERPDPRLADIDKARRESRRAGGVGRAASKAEPDDHGVAASPAGSASMGREEKSANTPPEEATKSALSGKRTDAPAAMRPASPGRTAGAPRVEARTPGAADGRADTRLDDIGKARRERGRAEAIVSAGNDAVPELQDAAKRRKGTVGMAGEEERATTPVKEATRPGPTEGRAVAPPVARIEATLEGARAVAPSEAAADAAPKAALSGAQRETARETEAKEIQSDSDERSPDWMPSREFLKRFSI